MYKKLPTHTNLNLMKLKPGLTHLLRHSSMVHGDHTGPDWWRCWQAYPWPKIEGVQCSQCLSYTYTATQICFLI